MLRENAASKVPKQDNQIHIFVEVSISMANKTRIPNRRRGAVMAEAVSALAVMFPLLVLIIFVTLEASYAYVIGRNMNNAAFLASRALGLKYQTYPGIVTDTAEQQAIFSTIRIPNMVSGNAQFTIMNWNTAASPPTVTVQVTYLPGQGTPALPSFPNPDPLNLGAAFRIGSSATYRMVQ